MHVLATAGHVDHGKSTLVLALTGTDPDRLAEEKARGLTIDLGFASTTLPSGHEVSFVDVPGHVRFIKNMLAGVGAVDACLFAVSATEGWKPQSEEHLRILDLLGITGGVIALTRSALVDPDRLAEVGDDVRRRVAGTCLRDSAIVATDAPSGAGTAELAIALGRLLDVTPRPVDRGRPRLWIDRRFFVAGTGTVVTGTLSGGSLRPHDELHVVPGSGPARRPLAVRVRSLESHGRSREVVGPGTRAALGLVGTAGTRLDRSSVTRGQAVVRLSQWAPSKTLDATLCVLADAPAPVGHRGAYHAYIGSGEHPVRLRVLGASSVDPGTTGLVRLHLQAQLPLLPGDRYVLRDAGRARTVGGGEVLEISPVSAAARAHPDRSLERVIAERGWVEADELERLTGERRAPTVGERWVVDPDVLAASKRRLLATIEAAGSFGLELAALDPRERVLVSSLASEGAVRVSDGWVRGHGGPDLSESPYLRALEGSPFSPPDPAAFGADRSELRALVAAGLVVQHDGVHFSASAVRGGARIVRDLLVRSPDGVTVSAVRGSLGTTRKYVLPFLSLLDAEGITRRRGDLRVAGPRLEEAARDPSDGDAYATTRGGSGGAG